MASVLVYYAHPGQRFSRANAALAKAARTAAVEDERLSFVDLYGDYPRHNISVDREQARLRAHDVILFQYPLYWYATPSLLKEWLDLVLEHGFAYGQDGTALAGKTMMLAITAAGPAEAYTPMGYQNHALRTFLTPMEQTAALCQMRFTPPYVLHGALQASEEGEIAAHAAGYAQLLRALLSDSYDFDAAATREIITAHTLPITQEVTP